jgi:hypothetical protein
MAQHPDAAALSSVQSDLEQLTRRIVAIADAHRGDADDPLTPQLDELERALVSVTRRLERTLRTL